MDRPVVRDIALAIFRLVLGVIFVAHGYQKLFIQGIDEIAGQFSASAIPQPKLSAYIAAIAELGGGALLVIGLLTTVVAGALALLMAAAFYFVHLGSGFFASSGGFEYVLLLIVSLMVVVVFGAGRLSVDWFLTRDAEL
ncbi:DoxX family protein [Corynebacterium sp. ES2794-CONJ1]|uniref:DoxX family protein n=1 Tax=unclassified Corynebacterium TaxID=2624378 RepID=UPI00216A7C73|nr:MULTISPECIES: DoxX family protein [unclassified Corynebacterium]MCS4490006.1 DoxX family protein [Corynebacterium sp. ES2775-CONJ]MCS4491631.1 DoxX family protein [Corynebacterium sp. ES2715-CONJ3]MCS4531736.1 DoxX family protein [Corynebacterium sp. ES2730-CONJ]MCU9519132.1 DoxX family protein [Corynebacterium sp. ES2794-CONJ1]